MDGDHDIMTVQASLTGRSRPCSSRLYDQRVALEGM